MGLRNPFRISIDSKTGWLYFGDVGPDAGTASVTRGPRGYDEINVAREAGNYGWPYCIADNEPYIDYDFETGLSGAPFDCDAPTNNSPNNTGSTTLPPPRGALLWYPYAESSEFPQLGSGGRTALAGPVYRQPPDGSSARAFPSLYDGDLFIYDWSRNWVKTVRFDGSGQPVEISPFPSPWEFRRPIDMEFGSDGALYVLEWGLRADAENDSGLYRIDYVEPDADNDGFGDETQDACPGVPGPQDGCPIPPQPQPEPEPQPQSKTQRTLTLDTNKNKVKKGKKVRFSGELDAPQSEGCEPGQTVELQRKAKGAPDAAFATFTQVETERGDQAGVFAATVKVKKTRVYRAAVAETAACDDEVSNTEKVRVKNKKRK